MKLLEDHINKLWASSKLSQAKRGITRLPCYVIYRVLDENRPLSGVLALEYFGSFFCRTNLRWPPRGGGGDSYMEPTGMLVGNFEFNP